MVPKSPLCCLGSLIVNGVGMNLTSDKEGCLEVLEWFIEFLLHLVWHEIGSHLSLSLRDGA